MIAVVMMGCIYLCKEHTAQGNSDTVDAISYTP